MLNLGLSNFLECKVKSQMIFTLVFQKRTNNSTYLNSPTVNTFMMQAGCQYYKYALFTYITFLVQNNHINVPLN